MLPEKVCAVVVSHNPGQKIVRVVDGLVPQVQRIVIVDNASNEANREILHGLQRRHPDAIELIFNSENRWLSGALNIGIEYAVRNGFNWVLEMNDGNTLSPTAVASMLGAYKMLPPGTVGMVMPRVVLASEGDEDLSDGSIVEEPLAATAGALVPTEIFARFGLHDEGLLIDFIDFEFSLRLRAAGLRVLTVRAVSIACELGRTERVRFFGRIVDCHNYSPLRRYYFARNGLALVLRTRDSKLARYYLSILPRELIKVMLYEDQKLEKLKMTGYGLTDALRGRLGDYQARSTVHDRPRAT